MPGQHCLTYGRATDSFSCSLKSGFPQLKALIRPENRFFLLKKSMINSHSEKGPKSALGWVVVLVFIKIC
jgi:hypothetical protein